MLNITVKETSVVKPAEETPRHALWLSNLDLLAPRRHIPTLYFYRNNAGVASGFFDPPVLKDALAKAMVHFYPMAGRYARNRLSGRLGIDCNAEGALFVVAETSALLDDLGDFAPSLELHKALVPSVDPSSDISSFPLVLVQITYFKCGGVALGLGMDHRLTDGTSAFHFVNSWSELARGLDLTLAPIIDRTILRARDPPQPMFEHIEYQPTPKMKSHQEISSSIDDQSPPTMSIFKLKREQINKLKEKCRENEEATKYSTYVVMAAHIWKCATIARSLRDDQVSKLYLSIDGRSRMQPPVPPNLLANMIFPVTPVATAGELKSKPSWHAASKIREALVRMDNDYLRSANDFLQTHPDLSSGGGLSLENFMSPNLGLVSWVRLPTYGADFGWGQPFYAGPAVVLCEGKSFVLPPALGDEDGSLSLIISLKHEHIEAFQELFYDI